MATTTTKKKIMLLSAAEYTTLSTTRKLTKDGVTYIYSPSDTIYCTPDDTVTESELTSGLATKLNANQGSTNAGKFLKVDNDGSVIYDTVSVTVDTAMSDSSTNAVQNKVIKSYVDTEIDNNIGEAMIQILGGGSNE